MSNHVFDTAGKLLGRWLQSGMAGCRFAVELQVKQGIQCAELDELDLDTVQIMLEHCAEQETFALAVLPDFEDESALAQWLVQFIEHEKWRIRTRADGARLLLQLEWLTPRGNWSNCMGLAPWPTMPVTRRAPRTCLALWPGSPNATHAPGEPLSFIDIPKPRKKKECSKEELKAYHRKLFKLTKDCVQAMNGVNHDIQLWRQVSFALPISAADHFAACDIF